MAAEFGPHLERVQALSVSPSSQLLALTGTRSGQASSSVHLFSLSHLKVSASLALGSSEGPSGSPIGSSSGTALAFASEDVLLVATADGLLAVLSVQTESAWERLSSPAEESGAGPAPSTQQVSLRLLGSHRLMVSAVRAMAACPLGQRIAAVGDAGVLTVFSPRVSEGKSLLEPLRTLSLSTQPLRTVRFSDDGRYVAAAGDDGRIWVVSLEDPQAPVRTMVCTQGPVYSLCFTPDERLAAGCADGSVRLFYLMGEPDEEDRSSDNAHTGPVIGLERSPELFDEGNRPLPRRLFSLSTDGTLKAWPLDSRRGPKSLSIEGSTPTALVWQPTRRTRPEERGGSLIIGTKERTLFVLALTEKAEPPEAKPSASFRRIDSALERLRSTLEAKAPKVRLATLEELRGIPEDEARLQMETLLASDAALEVRKQAALALGQSGRRLSRPALRKALEEAASEVRLAALEALVMLEGAESLAPIRAALASRQADVRAAGLRRLPGLKGVSPLVPTLLASSLRDQEVSVRGEAWQALQRFHGADVLTAIRTALAEGTDDIRASALASLTTHGLASSAEGRLLLEQGLEGARPVRQTAFVVAVASLPALAAALRPHSSGLLEALGKHLGPPPVVSAGEADAGDADAGERDETPALSEEERWPLFAALVSRHQDIAVLGATGLGVLGDERAIGALLQLSREPDVSVRLSALEGLRRTALAIPLDPRLESRIAWLLDDGDPNLRAAAFAALKDLCPPGSAPALLGIAERAMRSSRGDIRTQALQVLIKFGGNGPYSGLRVLAERADEILSEALDDEASNVRREAFRTLFTWHRQQLEIPLKRAVHSAHADIRKQAVEELARVKAPWAADLLLERVSDAVSIVALAAYKALLEDKSNRKKAAIHLPALKSMQADVRATGCRECLEAPASELRAALLPLLEEVTLEASLPAIEALERLVPGDEEALRMAFASPFYELRVRAAELCGQRRDARASAPMIALLGIAPYVYHRPTDVLRQRAARALADVGDPECMDAFITLLRDPDPLVREFAARGMATAARAGQEGPLLQALVHDDLPVRSWAAEGLARLGDRRAIPVLTGTLSHPHLPIRKGAIVGFTALGPEGVGGILAGLEDKEREMQDLIFALIVARDVALARAQQPPDLLLTALSSAHPEIRFAASRTLELRLEGKDLIPLVADLVGPARPEKASEMKGWPDAAKRTTYLQAVVATLASELPEQRYAAAQVLALRSQPEAFWREAKRLATPMDTSRPSIPVTNWQEEEKQSRRRDWIRSLFKRPAAEPPAPTERVLTVLRFAGARIPRAVPPKDAGDVDALALRKLAFGVYAGLLRQAPAQGEADETQRVRRDCLERLGALSPHVGREAVLPVLRQALNDPHHLVRRAAVTALKGFYPERSLEPLLLMLQASMPDVGQVAVDELVQAALEGRSGAREACTTLLEAPHAQVRAHALARLPSLYPGGSLEPWLLALGASRADIRLLAVDRLVHATDQRVTGALVSALSSSHDDLRLKAALTLAKRGEARTLEVLSAFLRSEDTDVAGEALQALLALAAANPADGTQEARRQGVAIALASRLEEDVDKTADRSALVEALGELHEIAGDFVLKAMLSDEDATVRSEAMEALWELAKDVAARPRRLPDGERLQPCREPLASSYLELMAASPYEEVRIFAAAKAFEIDDNAVEPILVKLMDDRIDRIRVAAATSLSKRLERCPQANVAPLLRALEGGRRELVLPAAVGLASRQRKEAFQPLLLVVRAGEEEERKSALVALGTLRDPRAVAEILPFVASEEEILEQDLPLIPSAAEALGALLPVIGEPDLRTTVREKVEELALSAKDTTLRLQALTGLRKAGDARSRTLLERVVLDEDADWQLREHAIEELGKMGMKEAEAALAQVLKDDSYSEEAMKALEQLFPEAPDRVYSLALEAGDEDIRAKAAEYLASRGSGEGLLERLVSLKAHDVRVRLRRGLVRRSLFPVAGLPSLLEGEAPLAREEAAWLAGASGAVSLAPAAEAALSLARTQWLAAKAACEAAGLLQEVDEEDENDRYDYDEDDHDDDDDTDERLIRLERCEKAWLAALWAAGRLERASSVEAMEAVVAKDAPRAVRREAMKQLVGRAEPDLLERLPALLDDADLEIRRLAGAALARTPARPLEPRPLEPRPLETLLGAVEPGADVLSRAPIAEVLLPQVGAPLLQTEVGRRAVMPSLVASRQDDLVLEVARAPGKGRLEAIAALGRMATPKALEVLQALLEQKGESEEVRKAAFRSLKRARRLRDYALRMADHG